MVTPQTESKELARELGIPYLYFKREDLHPYGSHKGRSIPIMIDTMEKTGANSFVISSSGNAALAAIRHIQNKNLAHPGNATTLTVLVGENINPEKRIMLEREIVDHEHIKLMEHERPLQALFRIVAGGRIKSLRQSTDPSALHGYKSLAFEMAATPELSDVFLATSSGTTAQALADYFIEYKKPVSIHVVQTTGNSSIAREFDREERGSEKSLADAIIDKVVHRKNQLTDALQRTSGAGWIVSNVEIERAMKLLKEKAGIEVSPNGVLGFAGLLRAIEKGKKFRGAVVCVITGK